MASAESLQKALLEDIPLTRAMCIRVAGYDGASLQLSAPLTPNMNHKGTAFGGSLYSLAVLCGWGLLQLKLDEAEAHHHIVIQEADIRYLLPVTEDMIAECRVDKDELSRILRTLLKHGRARISLTITIQQGGQTAVKFIGRYVVHA